MQLKVVWSLSLQTGSEGPALISNAASRFPMFRVPRSWHTVVCIPIDVNFELSACALRRPHAGIYCCFESVQRHVCDDGRDDTPLRSSRLGRKQGSFIDKSGLEPSPQDHLIHRYMFEDPVM